MFPILAQSCWVSLHLAHSGVILEGVEGDFGFRFFLISETTLLLLSPCGLSGGKKWTFLAFDGASDFRHMGAVKGIVLSMAV